MKKEVKQEDVERLREWLLMQPHHPKVIEDEILLAFVNGSKSLEIAKQKLESFFTWRARLSKTQPFFNIRDATDPYFKHCCKSGRMFFLPKTSPEGYRVLFNTTTEQFEECYDQDQITGLFHITLEISMARFPDMKGLFIIWDLEFFSPSYIAKLSFPTFEASVRYFQDSYPAQLKGLIFMNAPPVVETTYNTIFKPFLKEKLKKRIIITRENYSCLKRYLPEEIVPIDYGGKEKHSSELNDEWENVLVEKKEWLKNLALLFADESKRPPDMNHTFGLEGTFRTLAID